MDCNFLDRTHLEVLLGPCLRHWFDLFYWAPTNSLIYVALDEIYNSGSNFISVIKYFSTLRTGMGKIYRGRRVGGGLIKSLDMGI